MKKIKRWYYKHKSKKLKAKYQFGSPIIGMYVYGDLLIVYTELDIYVTMDGVNYERAKAL